MTVTILQLTPADFHPVDTLMKRYSQTLGFLPKEAIQSYLKKEKGGVLGAKIDTGQLVGYLLYATNPNYFRITHLCVSAEYRRQGIAKRLIDALKEAADTQRAIKLNCRRDFLANELWPKFGFVALGEKPSRSKMKRYLTTWHLTLVPDDQLEIFQAKTSVDALDVIIDSQILFDFDESDIDKTMPAKVLLSDFLVDSIELWITDETLNEINRQNNHEKRKKSQNRAQNFAIVEFNPDLVEEFGERLKRILPNSKPSQISDIRQLAKASASNVRTFVTRDGNLLKKRREIFDTTRLKVVNPAELIVQFHELFEGQSYTPDRIVGLDLRWERLTSSDLTGFTSNSFHKYREKKGRFMEKLEALIVQTDNYECELLRSGNEVIAIRVLKNDSNRTIISPLTRITHSADHLLFGRFLIADTITKAVEKNLDMIKFEISGLTPSLIPYLLEMGFVQCDNNFVRFCFTRCLSREEVLTAISELYPESIIKYQNISDSELERRCSPLVLDTTEEMCFLIPIRPDYAMGLIDQNQSTQDFFGWDPHILLRWDNVYYRKKNRHKMLTAPSRILWYVSGREKKVIALSRLDEVVIDTTKDLFKKFKRFGILKWKNLYEMCEHDPSKELMALKFSHTVLFREPISLHEVRIIFGKNCSGLSLQGPSKVPPEIFRELFQKGYVNHL